MLLRTEHHAHTESSAQRCGADQEEEDGKKDFWTNVEIVTVDQNEGDWGKGSRLSAADAVEYVRNVRALYEVVDYGDANTKSYRLVLSTSELPSKCLTPRTRVGTPDRCPVALRSGQA